MPPRAPCSPQTRKLPKYKTLARDLPANSTETVGRHRYRVNLLGPDRPCDLIAQHNQVVPGRTTCYAPTAHSTRRRTCQLLVDPQNPTHDFKPGMYLVPGPRLDPGDNVVCTAVDMIMYDTENVDTRLRPPNQPIVVVGPYVHPVTKLLTIKCVPLSSLNGVTTINQFGQIFQTLDMSERGAMVPTPDMIDEFIRRDLRVSTAPNARSIAQNLVPIYEKLSYNDTVLEKLDDMCARNPVLQKKVRTICKCFFEMALYFRRYAGPGRKIPLDLLQGVGHASNPLSPSLRGKFVRSSMTGVRIVSEGTGESNAADFVMQPEGTLTNMSQAHADSILMINDSLTYSQKRALHEAFKLGTPFRMIDRRTGFSSFYLDSTDPNRYNGNPEHFVLNIFNICFGSPSFNGGFYAVASVHGTRTYCVQIAAIQILRTVQTILPYIYKSRPMWAAADAEFDNVHT